MITYVDSFIFFAAAVLLALNPTASALEWKLKNASVQPGERGVLEIRHPVEPTDDEDEEPLPPNLDDDLVYKNKNLQLLEKSVIQSGNTWVWRYDFTAYSPGDYSIPPIQLKEGANTYSTEQIKLTVGSPRAEDDMELRPDYGEVARLFPWRRTIRAILLAGILFLVAYLGYRYRRFLRPKKRKIVRAEPAVVVPAEDIEAWLRREIAILRTRLKDEKPMSNGVDELTRIIRQYFTKRTAQTITALTSREILKTFETNPRILDLKPVLERSDRFRFAGEKVPNINTFALSLLDTTEPILATCGL